MAHRKKGGYRIVSYKFNTRVRAGRKPMTRERALSNLDSTDPEVVSAATVSLGIHKVFEARERLGKILKMEDGGSWNFTKFTAINALKQMGGKRSVEILIDALRLGVSVSHWSCQALFELSKTEPENFPTYVTLHKMRILFNSGDAEKLFEQVKGNIRIYQATKIGEALGRMEG